MIQLNNLRYTTVKVSKDINGLREQQIARLLEKFLLKQSVVCEVEVK